MNAVISETVKVAILGLGMQILEIPASLIRQCATPTLTPTSRQKLWLLQFKCYKKILTEMYWSRQYLSIDPKKDPRPL